MKEIAYNNIKKLIGNYQQNHLYFWEKVENKDRQNELLDSLLSKERLNKINLNGSMYKIDFIDFQVLDYQTHNQNNIIDNLIILDDRKETPIFELTEDNNINNGSGIKYYEYRLYDKNEKLVLKVKKRDKFINDELLQSQVSITEKISLTNRYISRNYDFLYRNSECCFLGVDNNYISLNDHSFDIRYSLVNSHIQKVKTVFKYYINTMLWLETITKIYQIKRKIKK